ncbi:uncharacterized protein M6B38_401695 [Iris pallida]|uniref:Uncharacterized protein n=1 Tax=Iris pallida TaxID=29817 RepID=A0AAX6FV70_IRIPA|nr:uncharacterized protein M6B38_225835 [Iris pallida]KAJ6819871.1 uncharacterized protein M6B38_401695 [Iris pallida]
MELIPSPAVLPTSRLRFRGGRRTAAPHLPNQPRAVRYRPAASDKDSFGFGGGLVDENMIVLRMRIHEMRVAEKGGELPCGWTEWEWKNYARYRAEVCEFAGTVQALLLNSRPGVAIGAVVLVAMSVPASAVLLSLHLMQMAKLAMHLG